MRGWRGNARAVAPTVAAAVVGLLMIMLAAQAGPHSLIHGQLRGSVGPGAGGNNAIQINLPGPPAAGKAHGPPPHEAFFHAVGWAIQAVLYLCLLAGLFFLVRLLVREVMRRLGPRSVPQAHEDFELLEAPERVTDAILDDAADQLAVLLGGAPRNAIVACWDRFEEQGERVGVARRSWETSSEYTIRLLDLVQADSAAVSRLERLYHEARFSEHDIDESRRESAVEALDAIHRSLGAKVANP